MSKIKIFSELVVLLLISFFVNLVSAQVNEKSVKEIANTELKKYIIECGNSYYIKRISAGLVELKNGGSVALNNIALSESDRLNGFEYKGILTLYYTGPIRNYQNWNKTWTAWEQATILIDIEIVKKNGDWLSRKSSDIFRGATYIEVSCNEVPKEVALNIEEKIRLYKWHIIDDAYIPKNEIEEIIKEYATESSILPVEIRNFGRDKEIFRIFQGKQIMNESIDYLDKFFPKKEDWMLVELKYKSNQGQLVFRAIIYVKQSGKWRVGDAGTLARSFNY